MRTVINIILHVCLLNVSITSYAYYHIIINIIIVADEGRDFGRIHSDQYL